MAATVATVAAHAAGGAAGGASLSAAGTATAAATASSTLAQPLTEPAALQTGLWLRQAGFSAQACGQGLAFQPVALPHDWHASGVARPGVGCYQLAFSLPAGSSAALQGQVWALWTAQMPTHHRLLVNGHPVSDTLGLREGLRQRVEPLAATSWPTALLRDGDNLVQIEAHSGLRAGLGALLLGPKPVVDHQAVLHRRLWTDTPRLLNLVVAGACLFMGVLWLGKRDERALGWFGAFGLLLAVRNALTLDASGHAPASWGTGLYLAGIAMTGLLGGFACSVAPRPWPWYPRLLALACGAGVLHALGASGDTLAQENARRMGYAVMVPLVAGALVLIGSHLRSLRPVPALALASTLLATFFAGLHDWLHHQGLLHLAGQYWLPWVAPWLLLAYGALLAQRLVRVLSEVQSLNRGLEQRVAERTASLAEANAAKSRFLAAASHDLRQPLVSIGLLVGLLREQLHSTAQRQLVARVDEALAAMETLLRGLLDLSRLEVGRVRARLQPVALHPLLTALAAQDEALARHQGLQLRLRVQPDAVVLADPVLLEQILRNLLSNALRYTRSGGVLLAAQRRGGQWRVGVWDTGVGIPSALQGRVFGEFVQAHNDHRDRQHGLGLGLAIAERAASLLNSQVRLRSRPGKGSCFWLLLPATHRASAHTPAEAGTPTAPSGPTAAPSPSPSPSPDTGPQALLQGRQVWLLEDEDSVREALADTLRAWGAEVSAWASPAGLLSALDSALLLAPTASGRPLQPASLHSTRPAALPSTGPAGRHPHLLVTDLRLPGSDGLAVAAQVRAALGPVPTLVITGNTAPEELARLAASGLPVLHKPFRPDALRAILQALLAP